MKEETADQVKDKVENRTKEWHETANPTSSFELGSWYGYDFANSAFNQAALGIWYPIFMYYLARDRACPYGRVEPENPNVGSPYTNSHDRPLKKSVLGEIKDDPYKGYYNASTVCQYDWDQVKDDVKNDPDNNLLNEDERKALLELEEPRYPVWWERGNSEFGIKYLPVQVRKQEPFCDKTGEKCNDKPKKPYDTARHATEDKRIHLIYPNVTQYVKCDYPNEKIKFKPMRNVTFYVGSEKGSGPSDADDFNDDAEKGFIDVPPFDGPEYEVKFSCEEGSTECENLTDKNITFKSTNYRLIHPKDIKKSYNPDTKEYTMTIIANYWKLGSSTIGIVVNDEMVMDFTMVLVSLPWCPFTVDFMGFKLLPITFGNTMISISVMCQLFFFASFSGLGDFGPYRKMILLQCAFIGSLSVMLPIALDGSNPNHYQYGGAFFIVANLLHGGSVVMYNAYLPFITRVSKLFLSCI